jgi:hypothetical protein
MIDWELTAWAAAAAAAAALIVVLASLLALAVAIRRNDRRTASEADRIAARLDQLGVEFAYLASANVAMRECLTAMGERIASTQQLQVAQSPGTGRAYELATRLAAGGAGPAELVASCGLTRSEADLAVLVHGARARVSAAA